MFVVEPAGLQDRFRCAQGFSFDVLALADGTPIRHGVAVPPGSARGTIVLATGFTEFVELYFETIRDLLAAGFRVHAFDWPGQGASGRPLDDREKAHSRGGFARYLEALARVIDTLPADAPRPITLVGHSLGGHLALRYLQDVPGQFDAAALSAPALEVGVDSPVPPHVTRIVVRIMDMLGFSERYALGAGPWEGGQARREKLLPHLSSDPERAALLAVWTQANPVLRVGGPTWGFGASFVASQALVLDDLRLGGVGIPVLIGSPRREIFTDARLHDVVVGKMPRARLMRFEEARHCLFLEADAFRAPWMEALVALAGSGKLPES